MKEMDGFKLYYERFLVACDALEESGVWPAEEMGEMDAWLANDLSCLITRLIAADGVIRGEEVERLNEALGFRCTTEELEAVYANCGERIDSFLERALPEDIAMLEGLNPVLAHDFCEMLGMIARIVIESDSEVRPEEKESAEKLLSVIGFRL